MSSLEPVPLGECLQTRDSSRPRSLRPRYLPRGHPVRVAAPRFVKDPHVLAAQHFYKISERRCVPLVCGLTQSFEPSQQGLGVRVGLKET